MARLNGTKLLLFDPITTAKMPVSAEYMAELIGVSIETISTYLYKRKPIHKIGCYLCKEDYTKKDFKELMDKWKDQEVKNEIWKYTDDTRGYQVSNLGRVRKMNKTTKPYFIIPYINSRSKGTFRVKLSYNGVYKEYVLHQIVANLFVINDDPVHKTYIIHKNGINTDNRANNLQYVTKLESALLGGKISKESRDYRRVVKKEIGTGKILDSYDSIVDAGRKTGIKYQNIYGAIIGYRPTAGRYEWGFEE